MTLTSCVVADEVICFSKRLAVPITFASISPESVKTTADILEELPADARPIFERLKAVRFQIAKEENVPAYIVFDNKTLHQMAFTVRARLKHSKLCVVSVQ